MAAAKKGANLTRKAGNALGKGALALGRGVGKGFQFFRNRESKAPGTFFGRNTKGRNVFGRGNSNNKGKTRTWRNFFGLGKKNKATPSAAAKKSFQKAFTKSVRALNTGNPNAAGEAIEALNAITKKLPDNPELVVPILDAAAAAEKEENIFEGLTVKSEYRPPQYKTSYANRLKQQEANFMLGRNHYLKQQEENHFLGNGGRRKTRRSY